MELDVQTLMMIFFIIFLTISIWKIYAFLPNKALADDDTTEASQEELIHLVLNAIKKSDGKMSVEELFQNVINDTTFDKKHFWRFNLNKLNQLLTHYYLENPDVHSIEDIYKQTSVV